MRLLGSGGSVVALAPVRYEFPGSGGLGWDANWLVVRGDVRAPAGDWSFEDPCLTTGEACELAAWLRGASAGAVPVTARPAGEPDLEFTEPNIAFSLRGREPGTVRIRVHLSLEALPEHWQRQRRLDLHEYFIDLDLSPDHLRGAADEWERELASFPPR